MGLATAATVRTNTGLTAQVADALIGAHLPAAEAAVLARIGSTIYAAITAAAGAPYTAAAKTALTRAESLLAGAIVLRSFLHNAGPLGMVTSVLSPTGEETQLASAGQKAAVASGWEAEAFLTLGPWEMLYQDALRDAGSELVQPPHTRHVGRLTFTAVGS